MGDSYIGILTWDACNLCACLVGGICVSGPELIDYLGEYVECGNFEEGEG